MKMRYDFSGVRDGDTIHFTLVVLARRMAAAFNNWSAKERKGLKARFARVEEDDRAGTGWRVWFSRNRTRDMRRLLASIDETGVKTVENASFGTPYSCGSVDSFYGREPKPYRWLADGPRTTDLTPEEIAAYHRGYRDNELAERKYEPEGDDYAEMDDDE